MANTNPPKKNQAFTLRVALQDFDTPGAFQSSPTLAAGDFRIDKDGGGFSNFATLPTVSPAASRSVLFSLSATEMNADVVTLDCSDQTATKEWADLFICIQTTV